MISPLPVIGICAAPELTRWSFWEQHASVVADSYAEAVRRAGGVPIGLLPQEPEPAVIAALLERVDGLLLVGGADLDPAVYGAELTERTEATQPQRDRFEIALVRGALARGLPALGVCRGLQVLNVATGGTLHQHLSDEGYGEHRPAPGRLDAPTHHEVEVEPGSLVAASGPVPRQTVNSHHHQGIATVGDGGRVTARSLPDGAVEAIEWREHGYVLGVQWHPEALEPSATIDDFVRAAARGGAVEAAA